MNILTLIIVLLILLVVLGMAAAMMMSGEATRKDRAMAVIRGSSGERVKKESGQSVQDKRRAEIARKLRESSEEEGSKKRATIPTKLRQAGLSWTMKQFWLFSLVMMIVFMVAAKAFGAPLLGVLFIGVAGFFFGPFMFLRHKIKKRQKKFLEEFADALEAMVRLLKAGMPVTEAIAMAGREYGGPVGEEMLRIYDAQKIGVPLPEAVLDASERMPITEMQMFATGISIQAQTGASLSEVLMNLAAVIRSRFRLKRKIQALSSEAKASAMIIGSLPFLVGGGLFFINPEYIGLLFNTTLGKIMIAGAAIWMGMGIMVMKVMINFKI